MARDTHRVDALVAEKTDVVAVDSPIDPERVMRQCRRGRQSSSIGQMTRPDANSG
jgi:hypothetical protein